MLLVHAHRWWRALELCALTNSLHRGSPLQVLNVFGNSGLGNTAGAQSTAPVVLGGATEADVAAAQAAQQEQGQPLAAGSR